MDPLILHAWLAARSVARGLPPPVADLGGFRVDTNADAEIARWVFPRMGAGLRDLARSILEPRYLLKLCGEGDDLRSALPPGWEVSAPGYFMRADGMFPRCPLADGYRIEVHHLDGVVEARVSSDTGALAARGYATETSEAFIYDRIVTEAEHRRRGLGHAVMTALQSAKRNPAVPELLVATEQGKALYATLGWTIISPYFTASIPVP